MNLPIYRTDGSPGALLEVVESGPRTLRLSGELDVSCTGPLAELQARDPATPGDLTLDLRRVEFMGSAGIHLFIKTARVGRECPIRVTTWD